MTIYKSSTGGVTMKGYVQNIESVAVKNEDKPEEKVEDKKLKKQRKKK